MNIKKFEAFNELDPYEEEIWNVDEPKPKKPFKRDRCHYCNRVIQHYDKNCPECKMPLDEYRKKKRDFEKVKTEFTKKWVGK